MSTPSHVGVCPIPLRGGRFRGLLGKLVFLFLLAALPAVVLAEGSILDDPSADQAQLDNGIATADQQKRTDAAAKLVDDLTAAYHQAVEHRDGTEAERVYPHLTKAKSDLKEQQLNLKEVIWEEQELQAMAAKRATATTHPSQGESRTVIFVCDATGSMITKIAELKLELSRAVWQLKPGQSFNIIFFQNEAIVKLDDTPIPASPENQQKADLWLRDIVTMGTTDPIPAILFAFKSKPDVIYFITDGADFPDMQAVRNGFRQQNAEHATKINTILIAENKEEQEANRDCEPLMRWVAGSSGGSFRWIALPEPK